MRAIYKLRAGPLRVYIWPRSWPWLVQLGRRSWWPFDRSRRARERAEHDVEAAVVRVTALQRKDSHG